MECILHSLKIFKHFDVFYEIFFFLIFVIAFTLEVLRQLFVCDFHPKFYQNETSKPINFYVERHKVIINAPQAKKLILISFAGVSSQIIFLLPFIIMLPVLCC